MLTTGQRNSVVAETIYILGLSSIEQRPKLEGKKPLAESETSSIVSIFGFGHDDHGRWTFAGHRPNRKDEPPQDEEIRLLPH